MKYTKLYLKHFWVIISVVGGGVGLLAAIPSPFFERDMVGYYCSPGTLFLWQDLSRNFYCGWIVYLVHLFGIMLVLLLLAIVIDFIQKNVGKPANYSTNYLNPTSKPADAKDARQAEEKPKTKFDLTVEKFSLHLDNHIDELRKKSLFQITGNGLSFLRRIKASPPFLGYDYHYPVIDSNQELKLTEYFRATEFLQKNQDSIKGGFFDTVTDKDTTWKIISKKHYGNIKFANQLKENNPYVNEPKTGMVVYIPAIDMNGVVLSSEYIEKQHTMASFDWIRSTIYYIVKEQVLSDEEVLPLLLAVFYAAQTTLDEETKGKNELEQKARNDLNSPYTFSLRNTRIECSHCHYGYEVDKGNKFLNLERKVTCPKCGNVDEFPRVIFNLD